MKLRQIRNATIILDYGEHRILVDPMLAGKGHIPSLKYLTKKRVKNPLVELPPDTESLLKTITHVLVTHCQKGHFDHLDRTAVKWIRENNIPVLCSSQDAGFLSMKGLKVIILYPEIVNEVLGLKISLIPCVHGRGVVGSFMAHGYGYVLKSPQHPSLYIVGDSVRTEEVTKALSAHQPEVVVMPGGGAKFDIGDEIIMGLSDVLPMAEAFSGSLIVNHLEALDHCPVTRVEVLEVARQNGLTDRIKAPLDGEELIFEKT